MNLCIIPARGGSKRIPQKNIKQFCGKPMIAWSIAAAQKSALFKHIIVSTDDEQIAKVAETYGALSPFRRPTKLSDDYTTTMPVINHAIREVEKNLGYYPKNVCVVYATAPFIQVNDLKHGLNQLISLKADFAFSITRFSYPIQRALKLNNSGKITMFQPEYKLTRSQDLESAYHDAGQFYWGKTKSFLEEREIFSNLSAAVVLPYWRVVDIDSEEDWRHAELLFRTLNL